MDDLKVPGKPFEISKRAVQAAWEKVKATSVTFCQLTTKMMLSVIYGLAFRGDQVPDPVSGARLDCAGGWREGS